MSKILIVDDDSRILMVVGAFLRQEGYEVQTASDGLAGVTAAKAAPPDLVVCDLDMPGMHGFDVLGALRADSGLGEVPVIFLTAHSGQTYQRKGMNLGADDFLAKPVDLDDLSAAIKARLRRRDEERARFQERMDLATQTFASAAHDLRDPLFVMCGYTSLLQAASPPSPAGSGTSQEMLARLQQAANRMQSIIAEVMFMARSRLQRLPFHPGQLDLRDFLGQLTREHPGADRIRLSCGKGDYGLVADVVRVRQAVENLISNALKYSEKPVHVRLTASQDACQIEVRDEGIGIPVAEQAELFEPFFRASNSRTIQGNGLGLCIVKSCVEQHGGQLECKSEPGKGTTFTIRLPRSAPRPTTTSASVSAAAAAASPPVSASASADAGDRPGQAGVPRGRRLRRGRKAMIVDDDPLVRGLMRDLLEETEGVEVRAEAGSLAEARLLLEQQTPDLLFLDVHLPDGTGFDLLPGLKASTKVIFVSGAEEHAVHAFDCEAVDYLLKPVSRDRLSQALERARSRPSKEAPDAPAEAAAQGSQAEGTQPILIKTLKGTQCVAVSEIKSVVAYGEYSWVYWGVQESALLRKSLRSWMAELPAPRFVRVHRNAIINLAFLTRIERRHDGSFQVHLRDTAEPLRVSQRLAGDLHRELKTFTHQAP